MHIAKNVGLVGLSGLLFCAGWHQPYTFFCLSFAFVPLLFLQDTFEDKQQVNYSVIGIFNTSGIYIFIAFLIFVSFTNYWLAYYSLFGALGIWIIQAVLLCLVFSLFQLTQKHFGNRLSYLAFVAYYMAFEYYNLTVDWAWPWTNLGNSLASNTAFIQWYEFTGIGGGSLWILLFNLNIFLMLKKWRTSQSISKKAGLTLVGLILLPVLISLALLKHHQFPSKNIKERVAIIQPNINSYEYKLNGFSKENLNKQINIIQPLLKTIKNQTFDCLLLPETVFPYVADIDSIFHHPANFLKPYLKPEGRIIFGMYLKNEQNTLGVLNTQNTQKYNAAVSINSRDSFQYHIKNHLVPGVEYLPFYKNKEKAFHKKYYTKPNKEILMTKGLDHPTAICYESIFGSDLAQQSRNKNKAILILTNDGWFDKSTLIQQHQNIAKLRAIENRRYVLRSANSGISSIINHYGKVKKELPNVEAGIIQQSIPKAFHTQTFYQKYPDILYRIFSLIALILLLYTLVAQFTHNFKFKKLGIK